MNEKDLQRLKEARIMDDNFGRIVLQDKNSGLELLRILGIIDETSVIMHYETQADINNMNNRSIVLDIYVINEQSEIDIEIENKKERAIAKRARLYASEMDVHMSYKGMDYQKLPNNIVIFICSFDFFKEGLPLYTIQRMVKELNIEFRDGSVILYLNTTYKGNDKLSRLYHDLYCNIPDEIENEILRNRLKYLKETKGGQDEMCKIWDDVRKEGHEKGLAEGHEKGKIEERINSIKHIMESLQCDVEKALQLLCIPETEWNDLKKSFE